MICYLIQCHHTPEQVEWLIRQLSDEGNCFVISVDGAESFFHEINYIFKDRDDVHVLRSVPVTWCGASQVVALLEGISAALERYSGWEMLINLSGQCFPTQPQKVIKDFLAKAISQDQKLFMSVFKPRHFDAITYSADVPSNLIDISIFDSKGTHCRIHSDLRPYFINWTESPVMKAYLRTAIWSVEEASEKTLYVRPLYKWEARYRNSVLKRWPHYCGRAWYMMHRSFLEWVSSGARTGEMFNLFSTVFEPDESFLQTLAMSEPEWAAKLVNANLRLNDGKPAVITDNNSGQIFGNNALFGRKLIYDKSPNIRKQIEIACGK